MTLIPHCFYCDDTQNEIVHALFYTLQLLWCSAYSILLILLLKIVELPFMPTYVVCPFDFIAEGTSKGFTLSDNLEIFIVKKDDQTFVYKNRCPHLGIELHWQEDQFLDQDGSLIQCSTHGALFVIETGECVAGPCLGKALEAIPYQVINNSITITL